MEYASSIQAVALRVTRLDSAGAPVVGTTGSFVTSMFGRVSFTPEYEAGEEIQEKRADGLTCSYYKMPDVLKKVNLEVAICHPQPEIYEMLAGGSLLSTGGVARSVSNKALTSNVATLTTAVAHGFTVGQTVVVTGVDATFDGTYVIASVPTTTTFTYAKTATNVTSAAATGTATAPLNNVGWAAPAIGEAPSTNGLGLEVWSRAIIDGRPAAIAPYWRWVFPYVQTRMSGDRVLENGAMAHAFSGEGLGNALFGNGPQNDWTFPTTSAMEYARDSVAPTGINNYQTVLAG